MIRRKKILKTLFKKFKWNFFYFFVLVFLTNYLTFLILFNLRQNFSYQQGKRGYFYFLFGKYSVIQEVQGDKIYINWNKLLLILLLLYFPLKIIIQSISDYLQDICQRKATVFLTKKLLNFAYKHKDLTTKNQEEKIYVINHVVPVLSRQFFAVPIRIFDIFIDLSFDLFWFYFLLKNSELFHLTPFLFFFVFINLFWLILFRIFTSKSAQLQKKKEVDYQEMEENQIKIFFKNLNDDRESVNLKKIHKSLEENSQHFSSLHFVSLFLNSSYLIIPGLHLLFLFFYYKFFLGGQGGLEWDLYFVALNVRGIFFLVRRTFKLLPTISSLLKNYRRVERFFD